LDEDVLDTNVFVSAVLELNSLPFLVVCWIDKHAGLLKSAVTEQEILNVLARPHIAALTVPSFRKDLAKRLASAELIATTKRIAACRDPTEFPASGTRRRRAGLAAHSGRSAP
jgi:predicted nucleic acid-binding protein